MGNLAKKECGVKGCDKLSIAKGFCAVHYSRWKRHGDPNISKYNRLHNNKCKVEDCTGIYKAKGYCDKHYDKIRRKGHLGAGPRDPRPAIIEDHIAKIPIGLNAKDGYFIVDIKDAWIDKHNFYNAKGYVCCWINGKSVRAHRLIMNIVDSKVLIDHKNGDKRDNTRTNLRIATRSENGANNNILKKSSKKFKCVYKEASGRWYCSITFQGKSMRVGTFDTPEQAAQAYDEKARELFGEFGRFNFPRDGEMPAR